MTDSLLEMLVEEELGSVGFAMDYLHLDFVNARFIAYVWPRVSLGDVSLEFGDPRGRDATAQEVPRNLTCSANV